MQSLCFEISAASDNRTTTSGSWRSAFTISTSRPSSQEYSSRNTAALALNHTKFPPPPSSAQQKVQHHTFAHWQEKPRSPPLRIPLPLP